MSHNGHTVGSSKGTMVGWGGMTASKVVVVTIVGLNLIVSFPKLDSVVASTSCLSFLCHPVELRGIGPFWTSYGPSPR
ncbi:MAG: hypothetical protein AAFO91_03930 [Bacteroidota bacterium]